MVYRRSTETQEKGLLAQMLVIKRRGEQMQCTCTVWWVIGDWLYDHFEAYVLVRAADRDTNPVLTRLTEITCAEQ